MVIYKQRLLVGPVLLLGGCYGQVTPLSPAQSDLTSGSLVAAGSIGIVALKGRTFTIVKNFHFHKSYKVDGVFFVSKCSNCGKS